MKRRDALRKGLTLTREGSNLLRRASQKSTSPELLRSQDLDQLSWLRTSGNDQQYKRLVAQLRRNRNFY